MRLCVRFTIYKNIPFLVFQNMVLTLMTNFGLDLLCFVQDQNYRLKNVTSEQEKNELFMTSLSDIIQRSNGHIHYIENDKTGKDTTGLTIFEMEDHYFISGYVKNIGGDVAC